MGIPSCSYPPGPLLSMSLRVQPSRHQATSRDRCIATVAASRSSAEGHQRSGLGWAISTAGPRPRSRRPFPRRQRLLGLFSLTAFSSPFQRVFLVHEGFDSPLLGPFVHPPIRLPFFLFLVNVSNIHFVVQFLSVSLVYYLVFFAFPLPSA